MKSKIFLLSAVAFFLADRLLKTLAAQKFSTPAGGEFFIIPKLFQFTFFANHHLAFSLPAPQNLTIIFSIIIISMLSLYLFQYLKSGKSGLALAISAIVLGAMSNFYDRVIFGYVVDYFRLWPVSYFNLADLMIGAGVLYLVLLFKSPRNYKFQAPNPK